MGLETALLAPIITGVAGAVTGSKKTSSTPTPTMSYPSSIEVTSSNPYAGVPWGDINEELVKRYEDEINKVWAEENFDKAYDYVMKPHQRQFQESVDLFSQNLLGNLAAAGVGQSGYYGDLVSNFATDLGNKYTDILGAQYAKDIEAQRYYSQAMSKALLDYLTKHSLGMEERGFTSEEGKLKRDAAIEQAKYIAQMQALSNIGKAWGSGALAGKTGGKTLTQALNEAAQSGASGIDTSAGSKEIAAWADTSGSYGTPPSPLKGNNIADDYFFMEAGDAGFQNNWYWSVGGDDYSDWGF